MTTTKPQTIKNIPLAQIFRNPGQPREFFDPEYVAELAESITKFGLQQPITVRDISPAPVEGVKAKPAYEIVMGETRWRAHDLAGMERIKSIVLNDEGMSTIDLFKLSLSENLNRRDMTPLEEARAFQRILDEEPGATVEAVAAEFGKTKAFVNLRLKLLDLTPAVAKQVELGAIGTGAAVVIAGLSHANQQALLRKWAKGELPSESELLHFAYALREQQNQVFALIVEDLTPEQAEERRAERTARRTTLDRIERVRALLDDIAREEPLKLALTLEGEIGARLEQLGRVADSVQKARFQLRQAKAHAEARFMALNPDATTGPVGPEEDAEEVDVEAAVTEAAEAVVAEAAADIEAQAEAEAGVEEDEQQAPA